MLGEVEDLWDQVAIAMYPSRKAMLEMISDPDYIISAGTGLLALKVS